jgi:hypothetical protein
MDDLYSAKKVSRRLLGRKEALLKFGIRGLQIALTDALLAHVERRLRVALSRFGPRIREAAVKLTDLNGPRGGFDKQCQDLASDRIECSVTRELERRRETLEHRSHAVNQCVHRKPLDRRGIMTLFSTRPPVEERIKRLKRMTGIRQ